MSLETNLLGRLRNTPLPLTSGLLPLFEAVVNSIHAIDEARPSPEEGAIKIIINREKQAFLEMDDEKKRRGPEPQDEIVGFTIIDNGVGFDDTNMMAFKTLDTDHKADIGGRGIGRLMWLKAFEKVEVSSCFFDADKNLICRSFMFEPQYGIRVEKLSEAVEGHTCGTTLSLVDFKPKYRKMAFKTAAPIARALVEHCLWYFVRPGGAPKITLEDQGENLDLNQEYEDHMHSSAVSDALEIRGNVFDLLHVKLRASAASFHAIAFCADNRLVCEEKLSGKIPGLPARLSDSQGEFVYRCYVNSDLLNECARPERTGFDFLGDLGELFADTDITWEDIKAGISAKASEYLVEHLNEVRQKGRERVETFVSTKGPRYRPIITRLPDDALYVDPDISDKELDVVLHRHLAEMESKLLSDGHDLMHPPENVTPDEYRQRLNEYLSEAEDIKKSDLANYVSHRKVILDLFEAAIQRQPDGQYAREDILHNLIMPMRKDSTEVPFDNCNLWLLDERLAFHDYLASDKSLSTMPITDSEETKEPDIAGLNVYDNPLLVSEGKSLPLASIVVVEIKRPMRNNAKAGETNDPIEQALGYLDRIRTGRVKTSSGRLIPQSDEIPGFCYVICDITPTIQNRCKVHDLTPTSDKMGYFAYKKSYKAYVELISFERLVNAAKERNRAFFDKLGLPTT